MSETSYRHVSTVLRTLSTSSAQSAAIGSGNGGRLCVRLYSDADCFVAIGADPTAVSSGASLPLAANSPEYFDIDPGDKIAGIVASGTGNLYISRMQKAG